MASRKVKEIIRLFRAKFQGEEVNVPVALRQESPDIVFSALQEEREDAASPLDALMSGLGDPMQNTAGMPMDMQQGMGQMPGMQEQMMGMGDIPLNAQPSPTNSMSAQGPDIEALLSELM